MKDIKLVALDLDGTLFDNSSHISERNLTAIRSITDKGIHVVISTGRPFEGIPFDQIKGTGINYAITANGSGIYEISTGKCLYENAMDEELVTPILNFLLIDVCVFGAQSAYACGDGRLVRIILIEFEGVSLILLLRWKNILKISSLPWPMFLCRVREHP